MITFLAVSELFFNLVTNISSIIKKDGMAYISLVWASEELKLLVDTDLKLDHLGSFMVFEVTSRLANKRYRICYKMFFKLLNLKLKILILGSRRKSKKGNLSLFDFFIRKIFIRKFSKMLTIL